MEIFIDKCQLSSINNDFSDLFNGEPDILLFICVQRKCCQKNHFDPRETFKNEGKKKEEEKNGPPFHSIPLWSIGLFNINWFGNYLFECSISATGAFVKHQIHHIDCDCDAANSNNNYSLKWDYNLRYLIGADVNGNVCNLPNCKASPIAHNKVYRRTQMRNSHIHSQYKLCWTLWVLSVEHVVTRKSLNFIA